MARRHSINIADDFERGRPIVDDDLPLAPPQFKRTPKKSFGGGSSALAGLPGAMGALNKSFNTSSPGRPRTARRRSGRRAPAG